MIAAVLLAACTAFFSTTVNADYNGGKYLVQYSYCMDDVAHDAGRKADVQVFLWEGRISHPVGPEFKVEEAHPGHEQDGRAMVEKALHLKDEGRPKG